MHRRSAIARERIANRRIAPSDLEEGDPLRWIRIPRDYILRCSAFG